MTHHGNIEGVDFAWLAVDDEGLVAIFMTGGEGPVPDSAQSNAGAELDVEELLSRAPEVTECRTHVTYPRPDDFLSAGRRGVFAFDWTDVHRTRSQRRQVYELVAEPEFPVNLEQLPVTLQALAHTTHLSGISFRKSLACGVTVGFVG
jgi:hypothetical protein